MFFSHSSMSSREGLPSDNSRDSLPSVRHIKEPGTLSYEPSDELALGLWDLFVSKLLLPL